MQIVVDIRRDANAQVILNQLFTYSQLEDTISMIHIALVPGAGGKLQPRVLTLRQILDQYIGFQKDVVERRTRLISRRRATVHTFWKSQGRNRQYRPYYCHHPRF